VLGRSRLEKRSRRRHGPLAIWLCLVAGLSVLALACAGASWGGSGYDPAADVNSMYSTTLYSGAQAWWNAGFTGKGVDVAVIDTGVSPVAGLDAPGKVIYGPDLSLESQAPNLTNLDTSGHGTFIAGLIAGRDAGLNAPYAAAPPSAYRGMAPDARIVSLKVGTADGGVDVSQVIAAIDWVVEHRHDRGLDIRVLNLSYGTNSAQSAEVDPLSYAVEQAWKRGIVVVAAAGNSGYQVGGGAPGVADPAYNPFVIAAGGSDSMGTPTLSDDTVGAYSASARCGPCKRPDFVAPGSHLQGLRVPGSYIDQTEPQGAISRRFFRGTGTSEAAAIVSGAVALVLDRYPRLDPDDVKAFFKQKAVDLPGQSRLSQGRGEIDLGAMLADQAPRNREQHHPEATGTGSLEVARGQDHVTRDGVVLSGEQDIFGKPFDSAEMAKLEGRANSWRGGRWNGSTWTGNDWAGNSWSGTVWAGNSWSGSSWSSATWSGNSWSGDGWSGNSWSGNSWSGSSWSGNSWSGSSWSSAGWLGASWGK
jgi:subtilisin family serine protease